MGFLMRKSRPGIKLRDVDALFSRYIRGRDGACVRCGKLDRLQAAHVISRRYHGTRYDEGNCHALCIYCHMWETHHPLEGQEFWKSFLGPDVFEALRARAMIHRGKLDLKEIAVDLREKLRGLESAA
jgi:hypothetical protein